MNKIAIIILILILVLVPVLGSTGCETGQLLYWLIHAMTCGVEVFVDGSYVGTTEQLIGFFDCVLLGEITEGEHTFDFVIPGSTVAAAASASSGKLMGASDAPDITMSYEGPVVDGGHYEVKLSWSTELGGAATMQNQNHTHEETITLDISSEPFEPPEPPVPLPPAFIADKTEVEVGETVTFDNLTTGGTWPYVKAEWDFDGDGVFDITLVGTHAEVMADVVWAYDAPGVYSVILQMTDSTPTTRWEERPDYITVTGEVALLGDANGDGVVNALDITKVERIIVGLDAETLGADANEDGMVNALDITTIEWIIVGMDFSDEA